MENLILTVDFGTQSVRVSFFNRKGQCVAFEKESYKPPYYSPKPGYAEQNPSYYFDEFCLASQRLFAAHPEKKEQIRGVVMSCFRDTAVLLDKNKEVIRPTILWLDQRYAKCEEPLPLVSRAAFSLVGMSEVINMNRRRTAANWVKENEPENWAKVDKYVGISTYFVYRLTGELKDCASDFTGHYPIDFKKRAWYRNPEKNIKGSIFSIKKEMLCDLVDSGQELGRISEEASKLTGIPAGIPMFAAGSDKACETLGTGVISEDMLSISLGTACTIETTSKRYVEPVKFLPAYPFAIPGYYNTDLQIYRGYWMINWFLKEFGGQDVEDMVSEEAADPTPFNEKLHTIPAGSDGVILQPFWGSQLDKPAVKGSIIGFSDVTTKEHVYRAIIEGIDYELRMAKEHFEKQFHHPFKEIRVAGGGAKSKEICQIAADIFNLPVTKIQTTETSSLGAAMAGFLAIKEYDSVEEAVENMVTPTETFYPNPDNVKVYDMLFNNVYKKLYKQLKPSYVYLYNFTAR